MNKINIFSVLLILSVCSCKFGVSKGAGASSSGQQPSPPPPSGPSLNYQQIANLSAKTDLEEIKQEVISLKMGKTDEEWNNILTQNGANLDILNNPEKAYALGYRVKAAEFANTNEDPNALKKYEIYKRSFSSPKEAVKNLVLNQDGSIEVANLLSLYNKPILEQKRLSNGSTKSVFTEGPLLSSVIEDFEQEVNDSLKDITNDKGLLMGNEIVESIKKQNNSGGRAARIKPFLKVNSPPVSKAEDLAKVLENNFVQNWDVAQQDIMALAINHSSEMLDAVIAYVNDKKAHETAVKSIITYINDISNDKLENFYVKLINNFLDNLDNYDEKSSSNLIKEIWGFEDENANEFFIKNNLFILALKKEPEVVQKLLKNEGFKDNFIISYDDFSKWIDNSRYTGNKEELKAQLVQLDTKDFDALVTQVNDGTIQWLYGITNKLNKPYTKYYFKNSFKDGKNQGTQLVEILKKLSATSSDIQDLKPIIDNKIPLVKKESGMSYDAFKTAVSNTLELLNLKTINDAIAILISTDPESLEACAYWIITNKKWDDFFAAVEANMVNDTNNVIDKKIWLAFNKKIIDEYLKEAQYEIQATIKNKPYLPGDGEDILTFRQYVNNLSFA